MMRDQTQPGLAFGATICHLRPHTVRRDLWIVAVECKWRAAGFDARNLRAFRARYPDGDNFVVTDDTVTSYVRDYRGVAVRFVNLPDLIRRVAAGA